MMQSCLQVMFKGMIVQSGPKGQWAVASRVAGKKRMLRKGGFCALLLQVFALKMCCAWSCWHRLMHEAWHVSWP